MTQLRQRLAEPLGTGSYAEPDRRLGARLPCQACGGGTLESFYTLRNVPAHSCLLLPSRAEALAFPRGDLELVFCHDCGFIGNARFDIRLNQYSAAYEETQAFSPRFLTFMDELCRDQIARFGLRPGITALEIGCGKGEFITRLCELSGCAGIGIDPGYRPERNQSAATDRITFIRDLYGPRYANLQAEYVSCRHTLEHIAPVQEFVRLVRQTIGNRDVNVFFELPDMERVLEAGVFWDVYYEHCTYFTRGSLARLFRAEGFDVQRLYKAYDGQYLMIEATPVNGPTLARLPQEDDLASTAALVRKFQIEVDNRLQQLAAAVERWRRSGQTVAIWGSGSKCVSLMCSLELGDLLQAIVDINPHKHGKFLAGSGWQISSPDVLAGLRPDAVIIMNSIYTEEIRNELATRSVQPELLPL
jgi:Methyltransferase domain/C-methyltransferase C-terminal domain